MKIGIDARMMGSLNTRGIGRYIQELVTALLASDPTLRLVLVVRDPEQSPFRSNERVEHVRADVPWYGLREQVEMPRILNGLEVDVLHIPHWNVPFLLRRSFVMTVHDLILLHHPYSQKTSTRFWLLGWFKHQVFRRLLAFNVRRAQSILVPTEFVKRDVLLSFRTSETTPKEKNMSADLESTGRPVRGVPARVRLARLGLVSRVRNDSLEDRVVVTGEGVREMNSETASPDSTPYLLYLGSAYPHKRLDLLVSAWSEVAKRHPSLELRIIGERDTFMQRIERSTVGLERVSFLGRLDDVAMFDQLRRAMLFVFPSDDEGFGLPPLEALVSGCPVVSSDSSCLPEVLPKEGVVFFRHGDRGSLIDAIERGLSEQSRLRSEVRSIRAEVLKRHDWNEAAKRTLMVYNRRVKDNA